MSHSPCLVAMKCSEKSISGDRPQSLEAHCHKLVELRLITKLTAELRSSNDYKPIAQDR